MRDLESKNKQILNQVQDDKKEDQDDGNRKLPKSYELDQQTIADIAASFQKAVVTALINNTQKAC